MDNINIGEPYIKLIEKFHSNMEKSCIDTIYTTKTTILIYNMQLSDNSKKIYEVSTKIDKLRNKINNIRKDILRLAAEFPTKSRNNVTYKTKNKQLGEDMLYLKNKLENKRNYQSSVINESNRILYKLSKIVEPSRNRFRKFTSINNMQLVIDNKKRKKECKKYRNTIIPVKHLTNKRGHKNKNILEENELKINSEIYIGCSFMKFIENFKIVLINILRTVNDECFTYDTTLNFIDLFYILAKRVSNNMSIPQVNQHLKNEKIAVINDNTINMKRNTVDYKYLKIVYEYLLSHINNCIALITNKLHIDKPLYSTDGTNVAFLKKLIESNYLVDKNNKFCPTLLNYVLDVSTNVAVDVKVSSEHNERKLLISQLDSIKPNSVIMGDGGYPNEAVIKKIKEKGMYYIFKIPKNFFVCKQFINSEKTEDICDFKGNPIRLIKYKYNEHSNNMYILGTSLTNVDEYPSNLIKQMYDQRWFIEEFFKNLKCNFNLKHMTSKTGNNIMQEIYTQLILTLIAKYFEIMGNYYIKIEKKINKKINTSVLIKNISNDFLLKLFYKKFDKKNKTKLITLIGDLLSNFTKIVDGRTSKRERKRPPTEFINIVKFTGD